MILKDKKNNKKYNIYKPIIRKERLGECKEEAIRGNFFLKIDLYNDYNEIVYTSKPYHPESTIYALFEEIEYSGKGLNGYISFRVCPKIAELNRNDLILDKSK